MSESLRRFTNTLIENKEPIRKEIGSEIAEWLAQGNKIHVLPSPCDRRKDRAKPLEPMPKLIKQRKSDFIHTPWDSEAEIEKLRLLRANGLRLADIASALNEEFGNDRNVDMIKSALARDKNGTLGPNGIRLAWSKQEKDWLFWLGKHWYNAREIAFHMNNLLGGCIRNRDSIRQYALGHKIFVLAEPRKSRKK